VEDLRLDRVIEHLRAARRITVLTGAGVSAASGVPPFSGADGLWRKVRAETLATPERLMSSRRLVASAVLVGFGWMVAGGAAFAQGKSQQGKDKQGTGKPAAAPRAEIGDRDRDAIGKYFKTNSAGLPPGLAKRGDDLPPGLEKQLQKNGKLPPGLEKKLEPVPVALERQLSPLPAGFSRRILGPHLLVVNEKTKALADVWLNSVR
jgi:hypothetical protein